MKISIDDINRAIKDTIGNTLILDNSSVYEKVENSDNLKLIIFLNKLFYKQTSVLYTKLIFVVNKEKTYLISNSFMYLYDINCIYKNVEFEDVEDFKKKLKDILNNDKFGVNIKILSEFIKTPALLINNWFSKNDITEISVMGLKYDPKILIVPCSSLFFSFTINLNNNETVELTITKEKENMYVYNFKIQDQVLGYPVKHLHVIQ